MKGYLRETRSIKLTINLLRLLGTWPVNNHKDKLISDSILVIVILSMVVSSFTTANDLYHRSGHLQGIVDTIPPAALVFSECMRLIVFIMNRHKISSLSKFTNDDFWQNELGPEEIKLYNKCDRLCYRANLSLTLGVLVVCWHYVLAPLGKIADERKLPFEIHSDVSLISPFYEIIYALQFFGAMTTGLCTSAFTAYIFTMNYFLAYQFEMLGMCLRSLGTYKSKMNDDKQQTETYEQFKKYVEKHQMLINYAHEMESLFSYVLLGSAGGTIVQIIFSGFKILLAESFTSSSMYISSVYFISSLLHMYFYCYSAHELYDKSANISTALYFSDWFTLTNQKIRKDYARLVLMVILRGRRPCILTIGKLYPLTLGTYTSILSTCTSFFTVIRQTLDR